MKKANTKKLVFTALCIALGIVLPMLFHIIPMANLGPSLCPMHIPVLLCGFLCGWPYAAVCGIAVPLLSSLITGMPPIYPVGVSMMFELVAYGILTGLLYRVFKGKIYITLMSAMIGGRLIMGLVNTVLFGMLGKGYSLTAFVTAAFVTSLPGIAIQLVLIPAIVYALKKSKLIDN